MEQCKANFYRTPKITFMVMKAKYFAGGKVMTNVTRSKTQTDIATLI
jgi:hypothetical protein